MTRLQGNTRYHTSQEPGPSRLRTSTSSLQNPSSLHNEDNEDAFNMTLSIHNFRRPKVLSQRTINSFVQRHTRNIPISCPIHNHSKTCPCFNKMRGV